MRKVSAWRTLEHALHHIKRSSVPRSTRAPPATSNKQKGLSMQEFIVQNGIDMSTLSIPLWLDLASVMVGAISGVLVAQEQKLDLVGFVSLAVLGGLGGGLIRDMIMQRGGVYAIDSVLAIPSVCIVGVAGFFFPGFLKRHPRSLEWVDIISVGLFAAAGTDKAMAYYLSPWACVLMGTLTGVGGGMARDIFIGQAPRIFKQSNYYAICAIAGSAAAYEAVFSLHMYRPIAAALCVIITVVLRRLSLHYNWVSPANVDLTDRFEDEAKKTGAKVLHFAARKKR